MKGVWNFFAAGSKEPEPPEDTTEASLWYKATKDQPFNSSVPVETHKGFNGKWTDIQTGKMIYIRGKQVFWGYHGSSTFEMIDDERIKFSEQEQTFTAELDVESQKVVWSTGDSWIRFFPGEVEGFDEEFMLTIAHRGQSMGFGYRYMTACLTVNSISTAGCVTDWNLSHPRQCMEVGDTIVELNGRPVSKFSLDSLKEFIKETQEMSLLVRKPWYQVKRNVD
mmetsp:Transcript_100814/g.193214  ORF Transcript_100814/g.193214 Transcript_100814/m.193214 type:complete len:223 (+) Transcript_100814:121-789(+)